MKQLLDEIFGDRREATGKRELHFAVDDVTKHVRFVVRVCEGRLCDEKLVHEDAEGPVVHGLVVPLREDKFGGKVLRSPAQRHALLVANTSRDPRNLLREAEIDDAQVSLLVDEKVLRLEVAVDVAQRVDLAEGARDAAGK